MGLTNMRVQRAVGQGFFHTASLTENDERRLSYVYDCGAMHRFAAARTREIDNYLSEVGAGSLLDILFISHIHADHLNGLEQLLAPSTGLRVDTIILPLVNVVERLIAFARTRVDDAASSQSSFYRDMVLDPASALARFDPRQIIFVQPGDREDGAPDGGERPFAPDGPDASGLDPDKARLGWRLVGTGAVTPLETIQQPDEFGDTAYVPQMLIPDTMAVLSTTSTGANWLLAPFVDPVISEQRDKFLDELSVQTKIPRANMEEWLQETAHVQQLVSTDLDLLTAAYAVVSKDLNITSLCLYSGPDRGTDMALGRQYHALFGCVHVPQRTQIAWLGSGDAALKQQKRREDFLQHYNQLLKEVVAFTLPHHGSDDNFHEDLLNDIKPQVCLAAAEKFSNWKHPGAHAVQAVCSLPAVMHVTTSNPTTEVRETARLG